MNLPGFVPRDSWSPLWLRQLLFGQPKAGKTTYSGTWPAPIFLHPVAESGYDTFRTPQGTNLFPHARLGEEHHLWLKEKSNKEVHQCVSAELRKWVDWLARETEKRTCPYQTVVLGGFNVLQEMVHGEGDKLFPTDGQKAWGYVLTWSTELIQTLCTLPLHVIFESGASVAVGGKDRGTGEVTNWTPAISGKTYNNVLAAVNMILWQERVNGRYYTSVSPLKTKANGVRFSFLNGVPPIENCSYDWFAAALGLPRIWEADPTHPWVLAARGQGWWPWSHQMMS